MKYEEVYGDLIIMAQEGAFDVIAHGCNCQCTMKRGLAPLMANAFRCDEFHLERGIYKGDVNKLGQIDHTNIHHKGKELVVVNCYIQYNPATAAEPRPINYQALKLCLHKLNYKFKGRHIGLPGWIGGGLAGGNPETIQYLIKRTMVDCDVTIVKLQLT